MIYIPKKWSIGGAIALGLIASTIAYVRLTTVTEESNFTEYWRRTGAAVYNKMASVPVNKIDSLRSSMQNTPVDDPEHNLETHSESCLSDLHDTVIDFITHRYAAASFEDYLSYMESQGYHLKTQKEFEKRYGPISQQAKNTGIDSNDPKTLFAAMWKYPPSNKATPTALALGDRAMAVTIASSNANRDFTSRLAGVLGEDLWHGGSAANCRFWMEPPVSRSTLVAKYHKIMAAQVGLIAVVPHSDRRPVILNLFYNPESQQWWIDTISVTNYLGSSDIWTCCEY